MPTLIYTDGCCIRNAGPGGYAAIIVNADGTHQEFSGSEAQTTSNRMELIAAIVALGTFDRRSELRVISDSQYLIRGMSDYLPRWKKNGWRTADRKPVKNQDLWIRLYAMDLGHDIEWVWIRGHNGDRFNELADLLANEAARNAVGVA